MRSHSSSVSVGPSSLPSCLLYLILPVHGTERGFITTSDPQRLTTRTAADSLTPDLTTFEQLPEESDQFKLLNYCSKNSLHLLFNNLSFSTAFNCTANLRPTCDNKCMNVIIGLVTNSDIFTRRTRIDCTLSYQFTFVDFICKIFHNMT